MSRGIEGAEAHGGKPMRAATAVRRRCAGPATAGARPPCTSSAAPVEWLACIAPAARRSSCSPALAVSALLAGCAGGASEGPTAGAAQIGAREPARVVAGRRRRHPEGAAGGRAAADGPGPGHRHAGDEEAGHAGRVRRAAGDRRDVRGSRCRGPAYARHGPGRRADRGPERRPGGPLRADPGLRGGRRARPRRAADRRRAGRPSTRSATGSSQRRARYERVEARAREQRRGVWGLCERRLPLLRAERPVSAGYGVQRSEVNGRAFACRSGAMRSAGRRRSPRRSRRRGRARRRPGRSPRRASRSSSCSWVYAVAVRPARRERGERGDLAVHDVRAPARDVREHVVDRGRPVDVRGEAHAVQAPEPVADLGPRQRRQLRRRHPQDRRRAARCRGSRTRVAGNEPYAVGCPAAATSKSCRSPASTGMPALVLGQVRELADQRLGRRRWSRTPAAASGRRPARRPRRRAAATSSPSSRNDDGGRGHG